MRVVSGSRAASRRHWRWAASVVLLLSAVVLGSVSAASGQDDEAAPRQLDVTGGEVAPQPEAATSVPAPQGGWDKGASAAPAPKPRQVGAPMVIGKR